MSKMFVYIVWDYDRAEHGEGPTIMDIFRSRERAVLFVNGPECWSESPDIEECEVK